ncbi:MAG: amidohydrolase family protein, partial [Deltaproteobacteria bacterium]|nr:amidohydrolase family protein [Deltaproteobacteria bacterium]
LTQKKVFEMSQNILLVCAGKIVIAHDQPPLAHGAVAVRGKKIEAVGPYHELAARYSGAKEIGGEQFLLIPGLINGHGHGKGLTDFQRGSLDDTLESWILGNRKFLPLPVYEDVALCAAKLLKSGVTTTMHNHALQKPVNCLEEFGEAIRAYRDTGIRVQFNPGIRNQNPFVYGDNEGFLQSLSEDSRKILTAPPPPGSLDAKDFVEAVSDLHNRHNSSMCRVGFGPMSPQWCTKDLLLEIKRAAQNLGCPIHTHALQSIFQKIFGLGSYGKTLIAYLDEIGFLGEEVVIGHCVWPTEKDIEVLSRTKTGVTHHPSCNLRVRNGIAPVFPMLQAGVRVGLGIDSKTINDDEDFIQEMKVCFLLHRLPSLELDSPHLTARQVFQMGTETNAGLLGYGSELGRIEPGRFADLVLLDYEKMCFPFVDPSHDPIEVLLYRGKGSDVHTVMVGGRIVVEEGRVLTMDEEDLGKKLTDAASRPRNEEEKALSRAVDELRAQVVRYYQDWTKKVEIEPYFSVNSREDGEK